MAKRPIYYDTETTGLRSDKDRVIEIAAFDPEQNKEFNELVNPEMPIPEESKRITGISDKDVENADTFHKVLPRFIEFCSGDTVLIAHNNDNFDKHFLIHEATRCQVTLPKFNYIDSLKWSRKYRPDLPRHSLQYLREIYQIEANNAHRALDDVKILYKIFSIMIDDLSMEQIFNLLYAETTVKYMPFGKHRGEILDKVPKHYLSWLNKSGALEKPGNVDLKNSLEKLSLI